MFIYQVPYEYLDRFLLVLNLPDIACSPSCHQVTPQLESVYLLTALPDWCHLQTYWQLNCRWRNNPWQRTAWKKAVLMRGVGLNVREYPPVYLNSFSFFFLIVCAKSISFWIVTNSLMKGSSVIANCTAWFTPVLCSCLGMNQRCFQP